MLGNISKKKGDNGDFYTKAVVDKKIKDAETAVRAYTDKAAADAKNDLYAEVGEKVGAVEETVKAKLDSTDTKLDTKVDKVSGKSLIDSGVARSLHKQAGGIVYTASRDAFTVGDVSDGGGVMSDMNGNVTYTFGSYAKITSYDVEVKKARKPAHRLSEKANTSDLANKVDKVSGKSLIDEDFANAVEWGGNTVNIHNGITTDGSIYIGGEVVAMAESPDGSEPIEHKLTEKANMSNSSGGFAAGEGAYAYGTKEVASGEIGLLGMTDLNAIQLGTGTNGQEFSAQVYDYVLVVSGEERGKKSATDGKKYIKDVGKLSNLTTTDKSSVVAAINEVKSSGGGDVLDNLTYDSTNDIINSDANLLLTNTNSVAAYNGTFRGDIKIGQLGANKWAYTISPITGFSTSVDVTCTSGNVVHNLSAKADTTNVLTRNNTQTFTPTGDYQPATKKYVDDLIAALRADLGLE